MPLSLFKLTCKVEVNPQPIFGLPKMLLKYFDILLLLQDFPYNAGINKRVRGKLQPNKTPKKADSGFSTIFTLN